VSGSSSSRYLRELEAERTAKKLRAELRDPPIIGRTITRLQALAKAASTLPEDPNPPTDGDEDLSRKHHDDDPTDGNSEDQVTLDTRADWKR
jgi:hypothetical protein